MPNPVNYRFSSWQPDSSTADTNHPVTELDPMSEGTSNDLAGWIRRLESEMRNLHSNSSQWEHWLGIKVPYSPSDLPPSFISSTQFNLTGNWLAGSGNFYGPIVVVGRRVKCYTTGNPAPVGVVGTITAASFAANLTTVTVNWDDGGAIDGSLSEVQFGIPSPAGSEPYKTHRLIHPADQTFVTFPVADTVFTFNMAPADFWQVEFTLFVLGGGTGGKVTVAPSLPPGAVFKMGIPGWSGAAAQWVNTGTLDLDGNSPFWKVTLVVLNGGVFGALGLTYTAGSIVTGIGALSTMIAQEVFQT